MPSTLLFCRLRVNQNRNKTQYEQQSAFDGSISHQRALTIHQFSGAALLLMTELVVCCLCCSSCPMVRGFALPAGGVLPALC
jgi:hypothetical protein